VTLTETAREATARVGRRRGLSLVGILLLGINLRTAVTSVGAVLGSIRADLGFSATVAGVLTTLPVLCFAAFGAVSPALTRRFGAERLVAVAAATGTAGLALRALLPSTPALLVTTVLAVAGAGVANVALPALVKRDFPRRVGIVTGAYTTALAGGTALAAAVTVPVSEALGGWRGGLGIWAPLAALAILPWLPLARRRPAPGAGWRASSSPRLSRKPLAWALAVFFGSQSANAYVIFGWLPEIYRHAGLSAGQAALLLTVVTGLQIPVALAIAAAAERLRDQRPLVALCVACYVAAYAGLLVAPASGAWVWAVLLGIGGGAFTLALAMIGMRGANASVTSALSGFAQSVGYLLAAGGPLLVGALLGLTGGFTTPLILMLATLVPMSVAGFFSGSGGTIGDEQPAPADARA
jgi:CP family cyanate transporter-like MFS transporter